MATLKLKFVVIFIELEPNLHKIYNGIVFEILHTRLNMWKLF
jgi:hypothetical protein